LTVLKRRYQAKDNEGNVIETPDEMWRRVARNVGGAELQYPGGEELAAGMEEDFYRVMSDLEFVPNSPTIMNAGRPLQMLSGCFVLPVGDSMEEIFDTIKHTALVQKAGGGTGFSFSRLRPAGDAVGSTGGVASGPVTFMHAYNAATEAVKQGSTRRGANMGILRVDHPDIRRFINIKAVEGSMINFNVSVAATDLFMGAVLGDGEYPLVNPRTGLEVATERARDIFDLIVELAWKTGDPGLVFLDRINADHPNAYLGEIESTNPCGEQPLLPYESCNLGSINLARMVHFDTRRAINWWKLAYTCALAVRFLDNVISVNRYPLQEITDMTLATRRIGLGVMGWADLLIQLGIRYDSGEALALASEVARFIRTKVHQASSELAEERGCYPAWGGSTYATAGRPMRNTAPITIAPTGTISIIAGCSSGIEPLYDLAYVRRQVETVMLDYNAALVHALQLEGWTDTAIERTMLRIAGPESLQDLSCIPQRIKEVFRTAHDISPEWHVRMQAAFQTYTDNAVSKTINFPHEATVDDVDRAYRMAYELGCKGITIYRDGSKDNQVLSSGNGYGHCPECQAALKYQEGCFSCSDPACGWGKCAV
jgi:ribonucleoside-diphosphate reductase alpha chain